MVFSDLDPTKPSTDTDPHPEREFMLVKTPDSIEEDDLSIKVKVL